MQVLKGYPDKYFPKSICYRYSVEAPWCTFIFVEKKEKCEHFGQKKCFMWSNAFVRFAYIYQICFISSPELIKLIGQLIV